MKKNTIDKKLLITLASTAIDREQARLLINRAFCERQSVARRDRGAITPEERDEVLSGSDKFLFMLSKKGKGAVIGAVLMTLGRDMEHGSFASIQYLAIAPEAQGQGFGKQLLLHVESCAAAARFTNSYLSIIYHPLYPQTKLAAFYLDQGYQFWKEEALPEQDATNWFEPQYHAEIQVRWYRKILIL